ncbi:M23 family metallopeptidase [Viscerimonas tarda]
MRKTILLTAFLLTLLGSAFAQYRKPMDIPLYLSGNFGELRNNHFHSGIDMKTQGVINKPVYCVADGYISRIFVSPAGYGRALYITHPQTGQVSVYGHLNNFMPQVALYVKEKQYEEESFRVNLLPEKTVFPVKRGEIIAYSGDAGSSGGPHLHFEIRDEKTENAIDPLQYYKTVITDNVAPEIRGIAVYPMEGEGIVNGSNQPLRQNITITKKGNYNPLRIPVKAWGKIGLAVKAYDRMTGTSNIYGVKRIRLYVDKKKVFESNINSYSFDDSAMLNSLIDFDAWRRNSSFYMKSFVEPGNRLPFYETIDKGYIIIDQERLYDLRYELSDAYDNTTVYDFQITGQKQAISQLKKGAMYMTWNKENRYANDSFSLFIPNGNLYKDFNLRLRQEAAKTYFSDIFSVNDSYIPFRDKAEMRIKLKSDTLSNKNQYGLVSVSNGKESWIGGTYTDGCIVADVREIGRKLAVSSDNEAPVITPVHPEKWEAEAAIKLRVSDNKSGINSFRGTIDGKFALFEHDVKSPVYTCKFDSQRLTKGKKRQLVFTATDACGNTSSYSSEF